MAPLTTVCSRLVAAIVALGVMVGPLRSARAAEGDGEERPVLFSLTVADGPLERCGGEPVLARAVADRLRREVFTAPSAADITISVAPDPEAQAADPFPARIVATDRSGVELGRREVPVPAADCPKAVETLAVVLAIMIGPPRTTTEPPRRRIEPERPAPVSPPIQYRPRASERPSPLPPPSAPPLRWTASPLVAVATGTGILPGIAWGIEGGVVVRPPLEHLAFLARGAYWLPQETGTRPPADVDRASAALLGCYEPLRSAAVVLAGCLGLDVGRIRARSAGLTQSSESSVIAGVLGEARLGYRLPLGERALVIEPSVGAQVSAIVRRDRFIYRDPSGRELTLLLPARGAVQTSFGVAVHFL